MTSLKILSGGAAQGLVASLAPKFREQTGLAIEGEFGAVGAMAGKLRGGWPADIVVLTAALIADLAGENLVTRASISDIGRVETAIAVRTGDPLASVDDAASLREVLLGADAIFVPDTQASTAGIHVAKVLQQLGIAEKSRPGSGSIRTAQPPCAIWPRPTPSGRSAARNRPRLSTPKA